MDDNPVHIQHTRGRQFRLYNVLMVLLMSAVSMSYGYSTFIIATTLAQPTFLAYFNLAGPNASSNANQLIATMNGLYQAGGFLAVFTTSFLVDKWEGRSVLPSARALRYSREHCLRGVSMWACLSSSASLVARGRS